LKPTALRRFVVVACAPYSLLGYRIKRVTRRMIVRRTRLTGKTQQQLWPDWRHHAFLTDLDGDVVAVDRFHREHAVVELAIKDLKAGAGLENLPSGVFSANSAWFQIAILAHNMIRWTTRLGGHDTDRLIVAHTIRTRLLALPGRLVNRAGQPTLLLPSRWPWAHNFTTILDTSARSNPRRHGKAPTDHVRVVHAANAAAPATATSVRFRLAHQARRQGDRPVGGASTP
jgi:hypothetical protein